MALLNQARSALVVALLGLAAASGPAQTTTAADAGVIRVWGHGHRGQDYILTLLKAWEAEYRTLHPDARFDNELDGDASAIGALFTDTADLALLDREASFIEVDAYQQGTGYNPFGIAVARGSVAATNHAPALMIYVNKQNPLGQLTLQQVDGIFDADHRMGPRRYKTWGDLGLTGEWAGKPIQLYTYNIQSAPVQFFERAAMKGSQKFSCCLKLFTNAPGSAAEAKIAAAVAADKYGLGLSTLPAPGLKAVAISGGEGEAAVLPSASSITEGSYPLARTIYLYAKRPPKAEVPAKVKAFMEYVVSPAGQAVVQRTGGYLPLSAQMAEQAKERLQ